MFFILSLASVKHFTLNTIRNLYLSVDTRIINQLSLDFRRVSNLLHKIELLTVLMKSWPADQLAVPEQYNRRPVLTHRGLGPLVNPLSCLDVDEANEIIFSRKNKLLLMLFCLVGKMRILVVLAVVASLQFSDALPLNGNVCLAHQN